MTKINDEKLASESTISCGQTEKSNDDVNVKQREAEESLLDYLASTTLHGINHACLVGVSRLRRCLWLLLLLAMTACYLTLAVYSFNRYYKYESTTSISRKTVDSLDFPAVSVCHTNFVSKSAIDASPNLQYLVSVMEDSEGLEFTNLTAQELRFAERILSRHNLAEMITGSSIDMVDSCRIDESVDCRHLLTSIINENHFCYTFQSQATAHEHGVFRSHRPGQRHGLCKYMYSLHSIVHRIVYHNREGDFEKDFGVLMRFHATQQL